MFSIIDRYILRLFLGYFAAGLIVFVTIFLTVDAMSMLMRFNDVTSSLLLKYYSFYLPEIINQMTPVACLMGTVFALSTLSKTNELVALYSCGMSLLRVAQPILLGVAAISAIVFFAGDRILPSFAKNKNYTYYVEIKKNPGQFSIVKTNKVWYRSKDALFNIKTMNAQSNSAQGLTLYYFDEAWHLIQMITAAEVKLNGATWDLFNGSVTIFTDDSSFPLTSSFKTKTITMGEDAKDIESTANPSEILSVSELAHFIEKNRDAGLDTTKYEVDYHSKYSYAFAALVMSLLGVAFSVGKTRSGGMMTNLSICLGLVFLYWIFYSSAITLGTHGAINPIVAAWTPNAIMLAISYHLIRKR